MFYIGEGRHMPSYLAKYGIFKGKIKYALKRVLMYHLEAAFSTGLALGVLKTSMCLIGQK